jgi:hypothetical protein
MCSKFIHLLFFSFFVLLLQPKVVWGKEKKTEVIQFANNQYLQIKNDKTLTPQQQVYQLSMPLLALATLKSNKHYEAVMKSIAFVLDDNFEKIEKPWQVWMLGRIALASKLANDSARLKEIKYQLFIQLAQHDNKDALTGWGFAYLAALDKDSYQKCRRKLLEYKGLAQNSYNQSPNTEASNFVWTLVMDLYSAASVGNKEDYLYFLQELKSLNEQNSVKESTLLVPNEDYRQWLVSLIRYSFRLMKDEVNFNELESIAKSEVDSLDTMLAWSNELADLK